jgi:two-component system response regulator YesN
MMKVFLVDDEIAIRENLRNSFPWEEKGYQLVGEAPDGEMALPMIRDLNPDILLTDIRMPNMDGLTMAAAVRSEYPGMQMAVLTAFRDFEYARQAIRLGVCRYLLKPSNLEELEETVREMVRRLDNRRE